MIESPVEHAPLLSADLGVELYVKRDDLLPFPLAGNKVRKLRYELANLGRTPDVVVSTGGVGSNHCRTLAWMAAQGGYRASLVLHGTPEDGASERMLRALGAECVYVEPSEIASTITRICDAEKAGGSDVHVVAGGCHTPAGVSAYRDAAAQTLGELPGINLVVVATGTGATHAGIVAGVAEVSPNTQVLGVSVARTRIRAEEAVREALSWSGEAHLGVKVDDRFIDGGYGQHSIETQQVVDRAWRRGLPLDPVYTGKAFRGLMKAVRHNRRRTLNVLFWHTGGLTNWIDSTQKYETNA